jgi:hypothetical protein
MHFSHVPPTHCKYTMTTPTPVQRTLFTLWENESQENELRVLLLPGCPFDSNDFTLIPRKIRMLGKGKSILWLCGSMMSNSAHCRIINCPRVEAIGTFLKGTNQFVERHFCLRRRVSGRWLEASSKYTHESPVSAKFISVHRHFTVSQGFAHELLYQANNRAAEVTMYGKLEVYTKTTTE